MIVFVCGKEGQNSRFCHHETKVQCSKCSEFGQKMKKNASSENRIPAMHVMPKLTNNGHILLVYTLCDEITCECN